MDQYLRGWMKREFSIGKYRLLGAELLYLAVLTGLAAAVRISVRSFVADDWSIYWSNWLAELSGHGFRALAEDFYDYAPPVMYLLYLITLLPVNPMTAFKGFCCILELLGAAVIGGIVLECTKSRRRAQYAYGIFLFLPTVILNASVWSQCDIIYTLLILCSVCFLLKGRTWTGMWFYGAAFAVKLQTLFVFPFLVILWLKKELKLKQFVTIPVMYLLGILPAWMAGRPFQELLGIYAFQGSKDRWSLSIKFPNIYQIIGNAHFLDEYVGAGMYLILGILMIVLFWMAYQKTQITKEYVILLVVFFGMLTTYFLPHMHERYLYLTDAFLLIYGMIRLRRFRLFLASAFLTVVGYAQYLTKAEPLVSYGVLAFIQLGLITVIGLDVYRWPAGISAGKPAPGNDREQIPGAEQRAVEESGTGKTADDLLRAFLFREFRAGGFRFDFLEGLLAVCITGAGFLLRTPFETGLPHWPYLLAEWYLGVAAAVLVCRLTGSGRRGLLTYAVLMILPTTVADGTLLGGNACVGALLFVSALLFLGVKPEKEHPWLFTLATAALLLWSVRYTGLLFACLVLWKQKRLRAEQLLVLLAAGAARFVYAYRMWFRAGYSLVTFHWPNIYEIVGREAVQGQAVDPVALVGFFLTLGLMVLSVRLFSQGELRRDKGEGVQILMLFLFFGLAAGYFLPYMDQSYGYLYCVLAVILAMAEPKNFFVPVLLEIVCYAGCQECLNGVSMMPMAVFAVIQILLTGWIGTGLLRNMGVLMRWIPDEREN